MYIKQPGNSQTSQQQPQGNSDETPSLPFIIPTTDDGTKIIESEFHTLFVSDEDAILKEFHTEDDGEMFTAIRELVPKHKRYTLYIETFAHDKNSLHKIINELRRATEFDVLEIRISSHGGYVSEGISIYNTMREIFNGRTETFLDSIAFSMGAMLFSLGDQRVIYEDSSLMYHTFSTGYGGKGDEIKTYIDYEVKHFEAFFTDKIVAKGFMSEDEYEQMKIGKDFWLSAIDMAERNISTHVIVAGVRLDNEAFIAYHNQDKSIEDWAMEQIAIMEEELLEQESSLIPETKKKKKAPKKKAPKKQEEKKESPKKKPTTKKKKSK